MTMMGSLKLVLIFGVGLVIGLGLFHLNTKLNKNLSDDYWPPQHNTVVNDTDHQLTCASRRKPGFDYFMFVLQWPAAFCNIHRNCSPHYPRDKFTVHGLWPQLNGAESPLYCESKTRNLKYEDLNKSRDDLLQYWPDLFNEAEYFSPENTSFWMRQWKRHGTCSSNKFRPQKYLKTTLKRAKEYAEPIFGNLTKRGIKPNGTTPYKEVDIIAAVKEATNNHTPIINMRLNYVGEHLLYEIYLCVKKDGRTLRNCDPVYYRFADPNKTKSHTDKISSI